MFTPKETGLCVCLESSLRGRPFEAIIGLKDSPCEIVCWAGATKTKYPFQKDRKYNVVVSVRSNRISLYVDGNLLSHVRTDGQYLGKPGNATWIGDNVAGLSAGFTSAVVHSAEIIEVKGRGRMVEPSPASELPILT